MGNKQWASYQSYQRIKVDLHQKIDDTGLDAMTLKRLYESKLVYLEELRRTCFRSLNSAEESSFTPDDLGFIITGIRITRSHLRALVRGVIDHLGQG